MVTTDRKMPGVVITDGKLDAAEGRAASAARRRVALTVAAAAGGEPPLDRDRWRIVFAADYAI
jgi:hypothetical protein